VAFDYRGPVGNDPEQVKRMDELLASLREKLLAANSYECRTEPGGFGDAGGSRTFYVTFRVEVPQHRD
jgi:hypothetical protein